MSHNPLPGMRSDFIEAMHTIRRLRISVGPKAYGNSMPEYIKEAWKDAPPDKTKVIVIPGADEIARMEACFDVVNANLNEADRHEIYTWGRVQTSRNATIRGFAEKMGLKEHQYRRKIDEIFQKLVVHWENNRILRLSTHVELSEKQGYESAKSDDLRTKTHWMADDAKPSGGAGRAENAMSRFSPGQSRDLIKGILGREELGRSPGPATG